ncbi:hypothetical protein [Chitinophaga sp. YR573]|nr:hypothetical protein [Chitinophaga sp. YR573]
MSMPIVAATIAATRGSTSPIVHPASGFSIIAAPVPVTAVRNSRRDHAD